MNKIALENVRKQFDSKVAVAGVSFDVPQGKAFGLLGPNGAGKTTLIRMILDIIKPDSGTILYNGCRLTLEDKDRITYLPEERGLYRKERVQDLLVYLARLKGMSLPEARRRTALYLARLEMSDVLDRRVEELSKGNQQKIQIAATLVSDPEVIVLDEPFVGLDPLNLRLSKDILSEERKAGKTILLSTHQMNQVEELCDSLFMLNQGVRVLYGTVAEIMDRYSEPALLVECSPIPEEIPEIDRIVRDGVAQKIYPKPGVSHTAVLKALIDRGVQIDSLRKATTPLEEIFIRVVRESRKEAQS